MASKFRLSYHQRLFLLLLAFSWILVVCFVAFQYNREKQYKVDKLDSQLQLYNTHLIDALTNDSIDFDAVEKRMPLDDVRVSIINSDGTLIFDNTLDSLPGENHMSRPEIAQAMTAGRGYTLRRHSTSTDKTYFYSATKGADVIVRSAVPYSISLQEVLAADSSFFWFAVATTLIISIIAYYMYELNARLQQTMTERDSEHSRAMHEQQEKIRIKKQLTNNINHELKTPVASIKVCLETIKEHSDLPKEKLLPFIEQSYQHTERLTNLLNDVSAITRMDDGAANIEKTELDLREIIDDTISAVKTDMEIVCNLPSAMPLVGNRLFLASIFSNLLNNSIAYSGGSKIVIGLDGECEKFYTLSVADNGCGIPEEHLERIFERFYRIDKGRSRLLGGTGLGLSIVRNAVQLHGGNIYATNLPTSGLKFVFSLAK